MNRKENMKGKKEGKKYNTYRKIKINKKTRKMEILIRNVEAK